MGRMEILTGVERRRDWSDDEKLSILQEAADPDARIADVAPLSGELSNQIFAELAHWEQVLKDTSLARQPAALSP